MVVLSRYRFKRSSNFMPRASTLLAWADEGSCSDGFLLLHPQLSVQLGDCMERLDRHLTSEGCKTLSMSKTSGKARVLSIRIQSHIYLSI